MLPKTVMRLILILILIQHSLDARPSVSEAGQFRVETRVLGEEYCKGDADLYSVSFKVDVEIFNTSKADIFLPKSMVPLGSKVADSIANAETEHYLFEESGTLVFPGNYQPDKGLLRIEPGKSVVIHTGYHLFARYDPSFSYPKSVVAGSYAIVLVLGPEMLAPSEAQGPQMIVQLKTEPFIVRVPDKPHMIDCKKRKDRRPHRSH
jgi:hypothetical protein